MLSEMSVFLPRVRGDEGHLGASALWYLGLYARYSASRFTQHCHWKVNTVRKANHGTGCHRETVHLRAPGCVLGELQGLKIHTSDTTARRLLIMAHPQSTGGVNSPPNRTFAGEGWTSDLNENLHVKRGNRAIDKQPLRGRGKQLESYHNSNF